MDAALQRTLDDLPAAPGCYLMKDRAGVVVYVGKASSLRSRVRSYFGAPRADERAFVALLDQLLGAIEVIVTRSEKEAVLLENELIKKHRPRFNVVFRDDKTFIVLRLDPTHPYPRLEVRRAKEARDPQARYFGPFSSAWSIRETLKLINRHFQLRTCTDHVLATRRRPCILYQIKRCPGPCVYEVPQEEYAASVQDAVAFLEGREPELAARLEARMAEAAGALRFEEAARLRDQLRAVARSLETQRVMLGDGADRDVVGLHREGPDLVVQVMVMRAGRLIDARAFPFRGQAAGDPEILSQFLAAYYEQAPAPEEVLLPLEPDGAEALAEVLSEGRGRRVRLLTPQRGAKVELLEGAARNAAQSFTQWHERDERREEALLGLTRGLSLARPPRWMECYDISTFQGALAVGSGVSMRDGEPDKAGYRRYKVKGVAGQDDFAMLHEVLVRRLRRGLAEGALPDLIVIDGGKGQLNAALAAARDLGVPVKPVPGSPEAPFVELIGLAKSRLVSGDLGATRVVSRRSRRGRGAGGAAGALADAAEAAEKGFVPEAERTPERVFLPGRKDPLVLRQNSAELFLLTRLRDEAHRFAITFHRKLRRERNFQSVLEAIPGIGDGRKRALLRHFGALKRVRQATPEELRLVEGFGEKQAAAVHAFFHPPGGGPGPAADEGGGADEAAAPGGAAAPTEDDIDRALAEEGGPA
ncbi:MAG: excinuclease ABC subunit UvrC [Anaeromyxobacter sp.]|nr:excinuclease ABC subunit UvrC [Anaeromyxobacter sp.]MBL0276094.1 excinuclease ABC subunit UvrC [Anaeromyxobacter sp.]